MISWILPADMFPMYRAFVCHGEESNVTARMSNISAFLLLDLTCFIIMSDNAAAAPAEVRAYSNERQKNQC